MNDCRGSLLERVRQGSASPDDRLAFDAHLSKCESCRLSWEVGAAFDRVGVAKNDGATIARLAARTLGQPEVFKTSSPSIPVVRARHAVFRPLILAALAFSGVAMAGVLTWSLADRTSERTMPPEADRSPARTRGTALPDSPREAGEHALPAAPPAPEGKNDVLPIQSAAGDEKAPNLVTPPPPSASSLFKAANDARRAGQRGTAVRRYRDLQRQFPASGEATLSRVSLGGLLLEEGQAASALEQFDVYLRSGPNKPLMAEALYGRGRALGALGRRQQEIKNWQQLLSAYPDSPYSGNARRRLDALRAK